MLLVLSLVLFIILHY